MHRQMIMRTLYDYYMRNATRIFLSNMAMCPTKGLVATASVDVCSYMMDIDMILDQSVFPAIKVLEERFFFRYKNTIVAFVADRRGLEPVLRDYVGAVNDDSIVEELCVFSLVG